MSDLISRLSKLRCQYNCFDENERDAYHTLSEAIKALSDVPDTNVGDTISRRAAIDALWKALFEYEDKTEKQFMETDELDVEDWVKHRVFVQNMNDIDRQTILDLPSADVQPVRHGKWIKAQRKGIMSYGDGFAECDKCHEVSYLGLNDKYCRNCGARMDGEQDVHSK